MTPDSAEILTVLGSERPLGEVQNVVKNDLVNYRRQMFVFVVELLQVRQTGWRL